jgi:hypothetical protein
MMKTHDAVILMAGTFFATRKLAEIAKNVELVVRNLDVALEEYPGDAFVAGWSCQRAQVSPVAVVICAHQIRESLLRQAERCRGEL